MSSATPRDDSFATTADPRSSSRAQAKVIPSNDVVILREADLDTDLATAIRRVRANDQTRLARILIVAPDRDEVRTSGLRDAQVDGEIERLAAPAMPVHARQLARLTEPEILQPLGTRLESLVECLDMFADETRAVLAELGDGAAEVPRARIAGSVRRVHEILDWAAATRRELRLEAERSTDGARRCSLPELAADAARALESYFPRLRIHLNEPSTTLPPVTARAAELTDAIFGILLIAAHRVGGEGPVEVDVATADTELCLRVVGYGEPRPIDLAERIAEVRAIIARCGGSIQPTAQGAGGTGIELRLPSC